MKLDALKIPVNPEYSFSEAPEGQHEYANPVTMNNKLVEMSNAYLDITAHMTRIIQQKKNIKAELTNTQNAMDDLEMDVLERTPPVATADNRTARTIHAYIVRQLRETGKLGQWSAARDEERQLQQQLSAVELQLEAARAALSALEMQGTIIQTHLSFVKNEARNARHYT
jgi:chaperonin cofactor prefoldin